MHAASCFAFWLPARGDAGSRRTVVRGAAAHAIRRIHLRHRRAGGRCGGQPLRRELSCGRARSARLAAGATRSRTVRRAARGQHRRRRSASAATGACIVADYKKHNIFAVRAGRDDPAGLFPFRQFNQPNDMAIARDGTIYASDPDWQRPRRPGLAHRAGRRRRGRGEVMASAAQADHHQRHRSQPGREDALCRRVRDARDLGLPDRRRASSPRRGW